MKILDCTCLSCGCRFDAEGGRLASCPKCHPTPTPVWMIEKQPAKLHPIPPGVEAVLAQPRNHFICGEEAERHKFSPDQVVHWPDRPPRKEFPMTRYLVLAVTLVLGLLAGLAASKPLPPPSPEAQRLIDSLDAGGWQLDEGRAVTLRHESAGLSIEPGTVLASVRWTSGKGRWNMNGCETINFSLSDRLHLRRAAEAWTERRLSRDLQARLAALDPTPSKDAVQLRDRAQFEALLEAARTGRVPPVVTYEERKP